MSISIIVASHGEFSKGIYQSASMIFGEQKNVETISFLPNEGPDDLYNKYEDALKKFDENDEVLCLVDLWSGSPFNLASKLAKTYENRKIVIVTGLNLPMLMVAYSMRMQADISVDLVASALIQESRDAIKVLPESLMPQTKSDPKQQETKKQALPKGTVVGDGKIKFNLVRIDTRLLHGQVATAWTPESKANRIIVVSDAVSKDTMRKELIKQAAPSNVKANVVPIDKFVEVYNDTRFGDVKALVLFETPQDLLEVCKKGVKFDTINVGSMAHTTGKVLVTNALSMNKEDVEVFEQLKSYGLKFDVRKVPNDSSKDLFELIKKANIK